jgi:HAD superfamily hydrolase (TIGR01509 family)
MGSANKGTRPLYDLVLFDNDGVLVDSEPHANAVLIHLLKSFGLSLTYEESFALFVGSSMSRVRKVAEDRLRRALPSSFEERYQTDLFERLRAGLMPIPGIQNTLDRIDIPRCVASSGSKDRVRVTLELTGLWSYFEGRVFSREDVSRGKPAPDLFLLAAETMGAKPKRCAVVEDSPLGIEAANAAEMTSFGFAREMPASRLREATGGIFRKMEELPALLGF